MGASGASKGGLTPWALAPRALTNIALAKTVEELGSLKLPQQVALRWDPLGAWHLHVAKWTLLPEPLPDVLEGTSLGPTNVSPRVHSHRHGWLHALQHIASALSKPERIGPQTLTCLAKDVTHFLSSELWSLIERLATNID